MDEKAVQLGIWSVSASQPKRLTRANVAFERTLEDWIEHDPSLLVTGLSVVGRQVRLDAGVLDLLGIDVVGRWVVIELKRANVRRDTVAQALDYVACIEQLSAAQLRESVSAYLQQSGTDLASFLNERHLSESIFEPSERDIQVHVVGLGRDPHLQRVLDSMKRRGYDITVITFELFENVSTGERLLLRQLTESDMLPTKPTASADDEIERVLQAADQNGVGKAFRIVHQAAIRHGLYPRTFKHSIMYTPPQHKGRCCIVAWAKPRSGRLVAYAVPEAFAEFFPIDEAEASQILGGTGQRLMTAEDVAAFDRAMKTLFDRIQQNTSQA